MVTIKSIEEKAKLYDEAVIRGSRLWESDSITRENYEYIFPELKESEDDRIMGNIIATIHLYYGEPLEDEAKEMIAWLERRGQTFTKKDVDDAYLKGVCDAKHELEKQGEKTSDKIVEKARTEKQRVLLTETDGVANIDWDCRSLNDVKILLEYGLDYIKKLEKQGEQKPTDNVETNLLAVERAKEMSPFMRSGFEQKPAWSEEDEKTINNICHIIRQYDKISKRENQPCWYVGDCLLWMQNIKDRVQPQPKQEWSEEYEKRIKNIEESLLAYKIIVMDNDMELANYIEKDIEWLKSLKDRYTWKPSDEQMNTLEYYMHTLVCNEHKEILFGLYADLKKLMEE